MTPLNPVSTPASTEARKEVGLSLVDPEKSSPLNDLDPTHQIRLVLNLYHETINTLERVPCGDDVNTLTQAIFVILEDDTLNIGDFIKKIVGTEP